MQQREFSEWHRQSVSTTYGSDRVHAEDCDGREEHGKARIEQATSYVRIAGDFDDSQRNASLREPNDACFTRRWLAGSG